MILEGKELEGKIGDFGTYSLDVNEKLVLDVVLKVDLLKELDKLVQKTDSAVLKKVFGALQGFFGVKTEVAAAPVAPVVNAEA